MDIPMERRFSRAYPIDESTHDLKLFPFVDNSLLPNYSIQLSKIQGVNLFSNIHSLNILYLDDKHVVVSIPDDDPLFTDENLPVSLSAIQVLLESNIEKDSKISKEIEIAVNRGAPLTSKYHFELTSVNPPANIYIMSIPSGKNFISTFKVMENWINQKKQCTTYTAAFNFIKQIIFNAADKRKSYINDTLKKI